MKKFKILLFVLLSCCTNFSMAAEPVPAEPVSFSDIFPEVLLELAQGGYKNTMKGFTAVPSPELLRVLENHYKNLRNPKTMEGLEEFVKYHQTVALQFLAKVEESKVELSADLQELWAEIESFSSEDSILEGTIHASLWIPRALWGVSDGIKSDPGTFELLKDAIEGDSTQRGLPVLYHADQLHPSTGKVGWQSGMWGALEVESIHDENTHREVHEYNPQRFQLAKAARQELKEHITIRPSIVFFPGSDKVGLSMLTWLMLSDVNCVALPPEGKRAHGIFMNPKDFAYHDYAHSLFTSSKRIMKEWSSKLMLQLMGKSTHSVAETALKEEEARNYIDAARIAGTLAMERYEAMKNLGKDLMVNAAETLKSALSGIDGKSGEAKAARRTYNETIACVFYIFHETGDLGLDVLDAQTPGEMLQRLFKRITDSFEERMQRFDSFVTDPRTGEIISEAEGGVDPKEVIGNMKATYSLEGETKTFADLAAQAFDAENPYELDVSPFLMQAKMTLKDGTKVQSTRQTSRLDYGDMQDVNALLRLVGRGVEMRDLTIMIPKQARAAVLAFESAVARQFMDLSKEVLARSLDVLGLGADAPAVDIPPAPAHAGEAAAGGGGGDAVVIEEDGFAALHPRTMAALGELDATPEVRTLVRGYAYKPQVEDEG